MRGAGRSQRVWTFFLLWMIGTVACQRGGKPEVDGSAQVLLQAGAYLRHIDACDGSAAAVLVASEDGRHVTIAVPLLRHHEVAAAIERGLNRRVGRNVEIPVGLGVIA